LENSKKRLEKEPQTKDIADIAEVGLLISVKKGYVCTPQAQGWAHRQTLLQSAYKRLVSTASKNENAEQYLGSPPVRETKKKKISLPE